MEKLIKGFWKRVVRWQGARTLALKELPNPYLLEDHIRGSALLTHEIVDHEFEHLRDGVGYGFVGLSDADEVVVALRTIPFLYLIGRDGKRRGRDTEPLMQEPLRLIVKGLQAIKAGLLIQARHRIPYGVHFSATWATNDTLKLLSAYLPRDRYPLMTAAIWDAGAPKVCLVVSGVVSHYRLNPLKALRDEALLGRWIEDAVLNLYLALDNGGFGNGSAGKSNAYPIIHP
jgi:hypothetical protein